MSGAASKSKKDAVPLDKSLPNPYLMAVFTAFLAGLFSIVGSYYTGKFQAERAMTQKQMDYRISAYGAFLERTDRAGEPVISQLLNVGSIAEHLATDSEIQAFEDKIAHLLRSHDIQDIYWQLNTDLNMLRLHGSKRVAEISDDLLKALLLRDSEINWSMYPDETTKAHESWKTAQINGIAYGFEGRVDSDERLMVISISILTKALIEQLREEIHGTST